MVRMVLYFTHSHLWRICVPFNSNFFTTGIQHQTEHPDFNTVLVNHVSLRPRLMDYGCIGLNAGLSKNINGVT